MSAKTSSGSRPAPYRSSGRSPSRPPSKRRVPLVAVLAGVLAVLLVGAVIVNALTADEGGSEADGTAVQTRPVAIEGEGLAGLPSDSAQPDPAVGQTAPIVDGGDFGGNAESIGGESGRPSLVVFVAHWCPHCRAEVPRLVEWRADGTIPEAVDLVAVSTSATPGQANYPPSAWLEREAWPGRIIVDDEDDTAAAAYGVTGFPFFVALDADGHVLARGSGELDQADVQALVGLLQQG